MRDPSSRYTPEQEAEAAADFLARGPRAAADVFRRMSLEPRNLPIADKIREIARLFDELGASAT